MSCLWELHFKCKDIALNIKGRRCINCATLIKKVEITTLSSDKAYFRARQVIRAKEGNYRAGEMVLVLALKLQESEFDPQNPCKKFGHCQVLVSLRLVEWSQADPCFHWSARLSLFRESQTKLRELVSNKVNKTWGTIPEGVPWPLHAHTHMAPAHTHTKVHYKM